MEQPLRCFLSSVHHDTRISCDAKGNVTTTSNRNKTEDFYILDESNGTTKIRSVSHGKHLSTTSDGRVEGSVSSEGKEYDSWYLHKDTRSGQYNISSIENARYIACDDGGATTVEDKEDATGWNLELLTGELCFVSLSEADKRLTCGPNGKIGMTDKYKGWEVWRFIGVGDGDVLISSRTHDRVLQDDPFGKVTSTQNSAGDWQKWKVERAPDGFDGVVIRSRSLGRYLRSDGEAVSTTRLFDGAGTTWHLGAAHSQRYFLYSVTHDKRVSCGKHGVVSTGNRKESETWELQALDNGLVVLKSTTCDTYLSCTENKNLDAIDIFSDKGMWKLKHSSCGMYIVSKLSDLALSCSSDGTLSLVSDPYTPSELWTLEPCLPPTINKTQMVALATGCAIAVASIALMPLAVTGVVGALGFGSGGVAAGSVAAGMMSAEGVVMAGGSAE